MLETHTIVSAFLEANCHVLWDSDAKEALVVDPGFGTAGAVGRLLQANGLSLGAILLTHGHADHIWDAAQIQSDQGAVPVYLTGPDIFFLDDPAGALGLSESAFGLPKWQKPANVTGTPVQFRPVSGVALRTIASPGHSPGSAVYLVGGADLKEPLALSGDVVFADSVGRTDLPGGDERAMRQSLRTLTNVLDPATRLLTGHGPSTHWGAELANNAYVARARQSG